MPSQTLSPATKPNKKGRGVCRHSLDAWQLTDDIHPDDLRGVSVFIYRVMFTQLSPDLIPLETTNGRVLVPQGDPLNRSAECYVRNFAHEIGVNPDLLAKWTGAVSKDVACDALKHLKAYYRSIGGSDDEPDVITGW